jgi:hypothetical protein
MRRPMQGAKRWNGIFRTFDQPDEPSEQREEGDGEVAEGEGQGQAGLTHDPRETRGGDYPQSQSGQAQAATQGNPDLEPSEGH